MRSPATLTFLAEYHKYWFNESTGKIFCLCTAPTPEAAASVHRVALVTAAGSVAAPSRSTSAARATSAQIGRAHV